MVQVRVLAALCVLAAALPLTPARAETAFVRARNFAWVPFEVTILPGDSVEWRNDDDVLHSVTEFSCRRAGGPGSPCLFDLDLRPGARFSYAFQTPGIYEYECALHLFRGQVTVLSDGSALPDLVATDVSVTHAAASAPTVMRVTATISNRSSAAGAGRSDVRYEYRSPGGGWRTVGAVLAPPIPGGSSAVVHFLWESRGRIGDFEFRVTANGFGQIAESDTTNNAAEAPGSVLTPPGTISPGIDLTEGP